MDLYCQVCDSKKDSNDFIIRSRKEPVSQKNVRCCKACNRERNKKRYHASSEVRAKSNKATMDWASRNRDKTKAAQKRYDTKNYVKRKAKDAVKTEIRSGRLIRQSCEACGTTHNVHAHHDLYEQDRWLDVRWLCCKHHNEWHAILDPLKADGEGKKMFDWVFAGFVRDKAPRGTKVKVMS